MMHKGTQTLDTQRLTLRRAHTDDAQAMYQNWASDPEVTKYLTWPVHENVAVTRMILESWIAEYAKPNYYQWMIVPRNLGQPIGTISVVHSRDKIASAEIGYCIGKPWWHRGYTAEALQAVMDYLFDQVGINRIEACHDVSNPNSGKVMKKCGMRLEGIHRAADRNNQGICDLARYAILREDR